VVGVALGILTVGVLVGILVFVGVGVFVFSGVLVGVGVLVFSGVLVGVLLGTGVGVEDGLGTDPHITPSLLSALLSPF